MKSKINFLEEVRSDLEANLPGWAIEVGRSPLAVTGVMKIENDGFILESYEVRVQLAPNHPHDHPIVFETGGKIERIPDQHINGDGSACLFVEDESSRYWRDTTKLSDFIKGPVYAYFVGQSVFAATGEWPFGERRHCLDGVLDFYREYFRVTDSIVVAAFLNLALRSPVKGHWSCPCGKGLILRNCHFAEVLQLQKMVKRSRMMAVTAIIDKTRAQPK